ncbi:MAG TPA: M56 family metallopeptidase [Rhodanobacter sp.]|nr:M56 family metallopeptidase [Rhodanobacter sp.]
MLYLGIRSLLPRGEWRYRFGMGVLLLLAACPLLTGWWLLGASEATSREAIEITAASGISAVASAKWSWDVVLDAVLPWLVLAWSAGVLLLSLRAWTQWRRLKILVRVAERAPALQARANDLILRFGLRRRVAVLRSKLVTTPVLVGWIRPVILLPMAVACNFSVSQVELILAHELAHIKRLDPLANLFQVVLETMHFYHPVVHWISRDVRNEREICCDQLALSVSGGSRHEFAVTLAELGELRENPDSLVLAANGGVLLDRVQYMILPTRGAAQKRTSARFVAVLLGAALIALTLRLELNQLRRSEGLADVSLPLPSTIAPFVIAMTGTGGAALNMNVAALLPHLAPLRVAPVTQGRNIDVAPVPLLPATIPESLVSSRQLALPMMATRVPNVVPALVPVDHKSSAAAMSAAGMVPVRIRHPIYPHMALMSGIEGQVVVEFGLAGDGSLKDLQVVNSEPANIFDQAAIRAMKGWKYAAPTTAAMQRRYRQTLKFVLDTTRADARTETATVAGGDEIRARQDCQIATGTHICRWLGDEAESARNRP